MQHSGHRRGVRCVCVFVGACVCVYVFGPKELMMQHSGHSRGVRCVCVYLWKRVYLCVCV